MDRVYTILNFAEPFAPLFFKSQLQNPSIAEQFLCISSWDFYYSKLLMPNDFYPN